MLMLHDGIQQTCSFSLVSCWFSLVSLCSTSLALSLSCCSCCCTYTNSISHREGTINVTPPPADVYSSILTASAGTLSCLQRLLPLISYAPPTTRHLPARLHERGAVMSAVHLYHCATSVTIIYYSCCTAWTIH